MAAEVEEPTGTLTFPVTDIEGSTRLLRDVGRVRYEEALGTHRRLPRDAVEANPERLFELVIDGSRTGSRRRVPDRSRASGQVAFSA